MACGITARRHNFNGLKRKEAMKNEVTNFLYYMYNSWCIDEAHLLFGKSLGNHIYAKWTEKMECSIDHNLLWYADLDRYCKQKIVDRANELYNK